MKKAAFGTILLFLLSLYTTTTFAYQREVKSVQRLRFLNSATGNSSETNSFQAKVDSMLNVTPTATRTTVAAEDARVARKALMRDNQLESLVTSGLTDNDFKESIRKDPSEEEDKSALVGMKDDMLLKDSKIERTERSYAFERAEFFRDLDDEKEEDKQLQQMMRKRAQEESIKIEEDSSPMGLKGNRFYFGPMSIPERDALIENASVYRDRLSEEGFPEADVDNIMSNISSGEELIIYMMTEEQYTYREARELLTQ